MEHGQGASQEMVSWTFDAGLPTTKTTLDGASVKWEEGDEIDLWYLNANDEPTCVVGTAGSAGATTKFTASLPVGDAPDHFWAAYPKGTGYLSYVESAEKFSIIVNRSKMDGSFKKANIMAAYSTAAAGSFAFKHAVGIVKVELPAGGVITHDAVDYTITTIRIKGKETSIASAGVAEVTTDGTAVTGFGEPAALTIGEGDDKEEYKKVMSAAVDLTDEVRTAGVAYIPSFPGELTNGFALRYYAEEGHIPALLTGDVAYTISRSHVLPIVESSSKIVWDYYVSSDGTGDGKSEANPMSLADLQTMITNGKDYMFLANQLTGTTFHFKKETYTLSSQFTFPAYGEMTRIIWDGQGAVLDGAEATGILKFTGKNLGFLASGFTLQNGKTKNGAAINVSVGTVADDNFYADFKDCLITNNVATANGGGGAVLIATTVRNGQLRFNNCSFTGNKATYASGGNGGVLYTANGTMAVLFNKCSFKGNIGTANGMQIYMNGSAARLGMNNCTINAGTAKVGNGSAITCKGYSVIANSTIWSSSLGMGNWGQIALGCSNTNEGADNGAKVINSLIKNTDASYASFYLHGNYRQNIEYCLYTPVKEANDPVYTLDHSLEIEDGGMGTKKENSVKVNDVSNIYYSFTTDYSTGMTFPTLDQVRTAIEGTTSIGPLFLQWLDTIEGSLTTDITGYDRAQDASHPGSWQKR
ncbi:MAG: hypothetical protein IJT74_04570 [Bacteroidales bacterium]|nr:hypothetical protein [Bacteroidales bacterium]